MPKVSVIIPNWNGKHLLEICLPSLLKQTFKDFEVIVVDNGSMDGSVEFVKKEYHRFKIIELDKNIGFAPAVNIGIKEAGGEYIVLINNDTKVDKDCLKFLAKAAEDHPEVGMVAAKMLSFYEPEKIDSAGDYIDAVGHANNIGLGEKDGQKYNKAGNVFLVTGGGGLFKKAVFEKVGFFDEDYFAYFEDVDLCLRAQMTGFKGWYQPQAIIYHIHKATSAKNKSFTEYLQYRNMTMTVIKDFPKELFLRDWNWLKIILVNLNTIRFLATQGYIAAALKAEWYILTHLFELLEKRKKIQQTVAVTEEYIIENIRPKKVSIFGILKKGF
ncbi:glycosyltransferase family 2 protein [Candidatus Parcubacteria bacterium]|nr:MAG: glycosyltransferase family 2 protein [Candidatus Parcubacteria bacterium]